MIDVSEGFKFACLNGTVKNNLDICVFGYNEDGSNLHIRNENIVSESMVIEQSICDESDLKFGGAAAGSFEIEVVGISDLTGKYITVWLTQSTDIPTAYEDVRVTYPGSQTFPGADLSTTYPEKFYPNDKVFPGYSYDVTNPELATYPAGYKYSHTFPIFSGEVFSCELSKNHLTRKLVAYDRMYWKGNINCTEWYQSLYKNKTTITIYELRKAICSRYRIIEQYPDDKLPGDNIEVEMTEEKVTVADLLRSFCEMSGVFCMLNGLGNLEYHTLSNDFEITESIRKPGTETYDFSYKDLDYKEFTRRFNGIACRYTNGYGGWFGSPDNRELHYTLIDNVLADAYKNTSWFNEISTHTKPDYYLLRYYRFGSYTPLRLTTPCRMWVQLGDKIQVKAHSYIMNDDGSISKGRDITLTSYVLSRKIKGIQAMMDEITANGEDMRYNELSEFQ